MDKERKRIDRMNSPVAGIDLGEKESSATYIAPDGDIREQFSFPMTLCWQGKRGINAHSHDI